mmetsp:Transcript_36702/g.84686  ORF Transcript_36702/g.84686 Transcript_36702/m.84686 type:complete len:85 (+) Transcript_36702:82-336(+)
MKVEQNVMTSPGSWNRRLAGNFKNLPENHLTPTFLEKFANLRGVQVKKHTTSRPPQRIRQNPSTLVAGQTVQNFGTNIIMIHDA